MMQMVLNKIQVPISDLHGMTPSAFSHIVLHSSYIPEYHFLPYLPNPISDILHRHDAGTRKTGQGILEVLSISKKSWGMYRLEPLSVLTSSRFKNE